MEIDVLTGQDMSLPEVGGMGTPFDEALIHHTESWYYHTPSMRLAWSSVISANLGDISAVQVECGSLLTLDTMVGSRTGRWRRGEARAAVQGGVRS